MNENFEKDERVSSSPSPNYEKYFLEEMKMIFFEKEAYKSKCSKKSWIFRLVGIGILLLSGFLGQKGVFNVYEVCLAASLGGAIVIQGLYYRIFYQQADWFVNYTSIDIDKINARLEDFKR